MEVIKLAERMSVGGRIQELTSAERLLGTNRVFRIWTTSGTRILKVYGTPARERRESHSLEALAGIEGLPEVVDTGVEDSTVHWTLFGDSGQWNIGALPESARTARKAGAILRAVHETSPNPLSNLSRGIDQEWVSVDFMSTFRRLERYRGKIGYSAELLEQARRVRPPFASEPRVAHTNTIPENFLVNDEGSVTLINWEWATLAPPEWDLTKSLWLMNLKAGPDAAIAFEDGYGRSIDPIQLDRWIVYHASMMLVFEAESTLRQDRYAYEYLVDELQRAVTSSTSAN
ncbi:MAG: aminoglycoside phosphotransferase family protein [bacterium]|nr:aminoglycoside phosphotransferase family protein [bacterium]